MKWVHMEVLLRVVCGVCASVMNDFRNHLIISRMICIVPMPRMSMMKQGSICQFPEERQGRCADRDLLLQRDLNCRCILLGRLCDNLL